MKHWEFNFVYFLHVGKKKRVWTEYSLIVFHSGFLKNFNNTSYFFSSIDAIKTELSIIFINVDLISGE